MKHFTFGGPTKAAVAFRKTPKTAQIWHVKDRRKVGGQIIHVCASKYAAKSFISMQPAEDIQFLSKEQVK